MTTRRFPKRPSLESMVDRVDQQRPGDVPGDTVPTGFPSIDRILGGGVRRRDLVVLGGDVGSGKSALALGLAFLYLPIVILVIYSFNASRLVTIWGGLSTRWYGALLEDDKFRAAALTSLEIGVMAATIALVLGTCAGMIMLDREHLGVLDISTARNAFGRQLHSFEADLDIAGMAGGMYPAVFIRAPYVERVGDDVEVLAEVDGHPVLCRSGPIMVASFHPELAGDLRLHQLFMEGV